MFEFLHVTYCRPISKNGIDGVSTEKSENYFPFVTRYAFKSLLLEPLSAEFSFWRRCPYGSNRGSIPIDFQLLLYLKINRYRLRPDNIARYLRGYDRHGPLPGLFWNALAAFYGVVRRPGGVTIDDCVYRAIFARTILARRRKSFATRTC